MKFKVGDKVRIITDLHKGLIGKITEVDDTNVPYKVTFDYDSISDNWYCWYCEKSLESLTKDIIEYQGKKYDVLYGRFSGNMADLLLKEHKEEILDNAEKKYLKNVIKPFRNRIIGIEKKECYMSDLDVESEIIFIIDKNQGHSLLPFRKNSMYVGMKLNESYTLEQLGL